MSSGNTYLTHAMINPIELIIQFIAALMFILYYTWPLMLIFTLAYWVTKLFLRK